jgi:predicted kinase
MTNLLAEAENVTPPVMRQRVHRMGRDERGAAKAWRVQAEAAIVHAHVTERANLARHRGADVTLCAAMQTGGWRAPNDR